MLVFAILAVLLTSGFAISSDFISITDVSRDSNATWTFGYPSLVKHVSFKSSMLDLCYWEVDSGKTILFDLWFMGKCNVSPQPNQYGVITCLLSNGIVNSSFAFAPLHKSMNVYINCKSMNIFMVSIHVQNSSSSMSHNVVVHTDRYDYGAKGVFGCSNNGGLFSSSGTKIQSNSTKCLAHATWEGQKDVRCWSAPIVHFMPENIVGSENVLFNISCYETSVSYPPVHLYELVVEDEIPQVLVNDEANMLIKLEWCFWNHKSGSDGSIKLKRTWNGKTAFCRATSNYTLQANKSALSERVNITVNYGPDFAEMNITTSGAHFNSTSLFLEGEQTVLMKCLNNGYPVANCHWTIYNDTCLNFNGKNCEMNVTIRDALNVSCTASNVEVQTSTITSVVVVPKIRSPVIRNESSSEVSNVTRREGRPLELLCEIPFSNDLKAIYDWLLPDGNLLANMQTLSKNLTRYDSGIYICKTSDKFGNYSSTIKMDVQYGPDYATNNITIGGLSYKNTTLYLKEKQTVSMKCLNNGYPVSNCHWTICNDTCLNFTGKNCEMNVTIRDALNVSCTASNVEVQTSAITSTVVIPKIRSTVVRNANGSDVLNVTRLAGSSLELMCSISYDSEFSTAYQWVDQNGGTLATTQTLSKIITRYDSGTYICKASDAFGIYSTRINLDVLYAPCPLNPERITCHWTLNEANLRQIKFYSNPPAVGYSLKKNGVEIKNDATELITYSAEHVLTFTFARNQTTKRDAGVYILELDNGYSLGNTSRTTFVIAVDQSPIFKPPLLLCALIGGGVFVLILAVVLGTWFAIRRRKKRQTAADEPKVHYDQVSSDTDRVDEVVYLAAEDVHAINPPGSDPGNGANAENNTQVLHGAGAYGHNSNDPVYASVDELDVVAYFAASDIPPKSLPGDARSSGACAEHLLPTSPPTSVEASCARRPVREMLPLPNSAQACVSDSDQSRAPSSPDVKTCPHDLADEASVTPADPMPRPPITDVSDYASTDAFSIPTPLPESMEKCGWACSVETHATVNDLKKSEVGRERIITSLSSDEIEALYSKADKSKKRQRADENNSSAENSARSDPGSLIAQRDSFRGAHPFPSDRPQPTTEFHTCDSSIQALPSSDEAEVRNSVRVENAVQEPLVTSPALVAFVYDCATDNTIPETTNAQVCSYASAEDMFRLPNPLPPSMESSGWASTTDAGERTNEGVDPVYEDINLRFSEVRQTMKAN